MHKLIDCISWDCSSASHGGILFQGRQTPDSRNSGQPIISEMRRNWARAVGNRIADVQQEPVARGLAVKRLSGGNYPDRTNAQWDGMSCMAAPP